MASVSAQSNVSAERCEKMWTDLEQEVEVQLQQVECTIELQLKNVRSQLDKDGQVESTSWISCIYHHVKLGKKSSVRENSMWS